MNLIRSTAAAVFAAAVCMAHAADNDIDRTREIAYTCSIMVDGKAQQQNVTAMYGIKGNDVVAAQLKIGDTVTPGMWRDSFPIMNRFISQDPDTPTTAWTTLPTDAAKLDQTNGGKLSVAQQKGSQHDIVLDNCKLDQAATAKLAR